MGDYLIVGLTIDSEVGKGGGRPIIPQDERREMLQSLGCVSSVILVRDSLDALQQVKPHIFVKGHDYTVKGLLPEEIAFCKAHNIEIRHTSFNPQTTSGIIERIRQCEFA